MAYPFFKIPPLKRFLSYVVPVTIANSSGTITPFLEFNFYRNQWQLATEEALYSDGTRYEPFRVAFKHIRKHRDLSKVADCLVLGTGLGSVVHILHDKYDCKASYSLVEYDEKILYWAIQNLSAHHISGLLPHCSDALSFVKKDIRQYDLICVDIFNGKEVPKVFTERDFLLDVQRRLKPGGICLMNYILNEEREYQDYLRNVRSIFPSIRIIERKQNRILLQY